MDSTQNKTIVKSKLTYKAFLFPLLAISLISVSFKIIFDNYPIGLLNLRWIDYFMTILFAFALVWIIKVEILRKFMFLEVTDTHIFLRNIFLNKRGFDFNELIGYETKVEVSRLGTFEETVILTKDKNKIILSEFFIDNYKDIKMKVTSKLRDYGGARKNVL